MRESLGDAIRDASQAFMIYGAQVAVLRVVYVIFVTRRQLIVWIVRQVDGAPRVRTFVKVTANQTYVP